jgi:4-cresol dehydrogenase (hydroxylating)
VTVAPDIARAIAAWAGIVGPEHVLTGPDPRLAGYRQTTFATASGADVVVRPSTIAEARACMAVALAEKVPFHPSSRGRNLGWGARVPGDGLRVVFDFRRMDRILSFDKRLGVLEVEVGVTQASTHELLEREAPDWMIDATTSAQDSSLLANAIERGHGMGIFADHAHHVGGLQVLLADGRLIETGWREFDGARCAGLSDIGPGLQLGALFVQSNLGVVLSGTIQLARRPEAAILGIVELADDDALLAAIPLLLELKLRGLVQAGPRIDNVFRILQQGSRLVELVGEVRHVPLKEARLLAAARGLPPWRSLLTIAGDLPVVRASATRIAEIVNGRGVGVRFVGLDEGPRTSAEVALLAILRGTPAEVGLRRLAWRKPANAVISDGETDGCGFLFLTTVLPFTAEAVAQVRTLVENTVGDAEFEPEMSFLSLHERVLHGHVSITYDRAIDGEDGRARALHDRLLDVLAAEGFHPYRLGIQSFSHMRRVAPSAWKLLRQLKDALDPDGIIAPGRYLPGA